MFRGKHALLPGWLLLMTFIILAKKAPCYTLIMVKSGTTYFLKEYGSWSVLVVSYLIGILVSHAFSFALIPLLLSLGVLINSKQAFMRWTRKLEDRMSLGIFLGQIIVGGIVLAVLFRDDVPRLLPLLVIPAAYLLSARFGGEHALLSEVLGFALISLAAVLAKFALTNGVDVRLFVGVALYFTAGVFKIKAVLLKKTHDRVLAVAYVIFVLLVYRGFHISVIILLPLLDNVVASATLYKVRLQTTGWIEVAKSILFLSLFVFYY
jgi:hypothetical protein